MGSHPWVASGFMLMLVWNNLIQFAEIVGITSVGRNVCSVSSKVCVF